MGRFLLLSRENLLVQLVGDLLQAVCEAVVGDTDWYIFGNTGLAV